MIKTVLIDDEVNNTIYLQGLLQEHFAEVDIAGAATNAIDGAALLKELQQ